MSFDDEKKDDEKGHKNFGKKGGNLDGSRHTDRLRTTAQKFEALVEQIRDEMPCPHCGRGWNDTGHGSDGEDQ